MIHELNIFKHYDQCLMIMKSWQKLFNNDKIIPDYELKNRKRKKRIDESIETDTVFNGREHFKINSIYVICDSLVEELKKRKISYDNIISKYFFFLNISEQKTREVRDGAKQLRNIYKDDLDETFEMSVFIFRP